MKSTEFDYIISLCKSVAGAIPAKGCTSVEVQLSQAIAPGLLTAAEFDRAFKRLAKMSVRAEDIAESLKKLSGR